MNPPPIVHSDEPVTLIGGAGAPRADLMHALGLAPVLVAADGGATTALALGLSPVAVIGDMDSLPPEAARAFADRLHRVAEQETTDFDKALTRIEAPAVLALGFAGGRLDHELAALHSLVLRADRPCLLLGPATLAFHAPPEIELPLEAGTVVSLFPLAPVRVGSRGLVWPTDHLLFGPLTRIGTSNAAAGPVALRPSGPGMLVILPRATLPLALGALRVAPRWPAAPGG
ncbi:thiamine pyrophosphokinase [Rubellimicrobium roseum]|uniref:Thiamine pyrophosphokinase n=1 Tax=Rubellimicrobium roseum TaxID=687525 RepID=A0A5C4NBW0_9RHOB|nr:thiamine pyrophosphokinase [Rubellimicrobium roseum]TNC63553.1 thiamine pyrophosphokinase [Rubellimicrobium roseum]